TILKEIVRIGLPNGLQQSFVAFGMIALLRFVNNFGTDAVAAYTAAGRIDAFASLPAMNFSFALTAFIGQNIGANKQERIKKGLFATLIITAIISLSITLLTVLFRFPLMALFTNDANIIKIGAHYLIIVCSFYIMFSTLLVMNGLFRGAGDTLIPMFITLFSLWVIRIPLSWFLSARIGVDGVWWSIPMAWAIGMVFSIIYYYKGNWKNKAVTR
nr:MATE family efflux transporter [Bacteroidales bacterium]